MVERQFSLNVGGMTLPTPCFFSSISDVKTNLSPLEYLRILLAVQQPLFLISAYDVYHASPNNRRSMERLLTRAYSSKTIVLLDSGNYEAYWTSDKKWTRKKFANVLRLQRFQLAFCYDNQNPPKSVKAIVNDVEASVLRDQKNSLETTIVPIVHGTNSVLPTAAREVAERLRPILLAVPERVLGDGIVARANTVWQIRCALNRVGYYCPLHLLGTGNPLSILVYAICGADSFDALEWCQTAADHSTGRLYHFQQWDFFSDQIPVSTVSTLPYAQAVLVHNLLFYQHWLSLICDALKTNQGKELAKSYLPTEAMKKLHREIPELF
jgi:queuine/archaeosine tRNA-ribosyltransferase